MTKDDTLLSLFILENVHGKVLTEFIMDAIEASCPQHFNYFNGFRDACNRENCDQCWLRAFLEKRTGEI